MRIVSRVVCATSVLFAIPFVVAVSAGSAIAQQMRPDPTDAATPVPTITVAPAFADYRPFQEQKVAPWKQILEEVIGVPGAARHADHGATASETSESKETKPGSRGNERHDNVAKTEPQSSSLAEKPAAESGITIAAKGIVQSIDKANGKVKLTHDPITALGWPKMTMFFRLKDAALAEQIKEGDAVQFDLEKSPSGYVISGFKKAMPDHGMRDMNKGDKP